jgi:hypothetical protein
MILADTSVWIDHLRHGNAQLSYQLEAQSIACHSHIIGELALGSMRNRGEILGLLSALPASIEAQHGEVLEMIDRHALHSKGIGYTDAHLLASTMLSQDLRLWTLDKRLMAIATDFSLPYSTALD